MPSCYGASQAASNGTAAGRAARLLFCGVPARLLPRGEARSGERVKARAAAAAWTVGPLFWPVCLLTFTFGEAAQWS
jgi:hypothetical protein